MKAGHVELLKNGSVKMHYFDLNWRCGWLNYLNTNVYMWEKIAVKVGSMLCGICTATCGSLQ